MNIDYVSAKDVSLSVTSNPLEKMCFVNAPNTNITQQESRLESAIDQVCKILDEALNEGGKINYIPVNEAIYEVCGRDPNFKRAVFSSKKVIDEMQSVFWNCCMDQWTAPITTGRYSVLTLLDANLDFEQKKDLFNFFAQISDRIKQYDSIDRDALDYFLQYVPDKVLNMISEDPKMFADRLAYDVNLMLQGINKNALLEDAVFNALSGVTTEKTKVLLNTWKDDIKVEMNRMNGRPHSDHVFNELQTFLTRFLGEDGANEYTQFLIG